jgi:hypothetical protein
MTAKRNKATGLGFETIFELQARQRGLYAEKNLLSARFLPTKKLIAVKSRLDFNLMTNTGKAAFVDLKSFVGESFTYSSIEPHQLGQALNYESRGFPSGFVVWFRKTNAVVFFSARTIQQAGPGNSFDATKGKILGQFESFNAGLIFLGEGVH